MSQLARILLWRREEEGSNGVKVEEQFAVAVDVYDGDARGMYM